MVVRRVCVDINIVGHDVNILIALKEQSTCRGSCTLHLGDVVTVGLGLA
jgi:hypothetical protein